MKLIKKMVAMAMALSLLLFAVSPVYAGSNCATGVGLSNMGGDNKLDTGMVAALIEALKTIQNSTRTVQVFGGYQNKFLASDEQFSFIDIDHIHSYFDIVSVIQTQDMAVVGDSSILSLNGSSTQYITLDNMLISPSGDKLDFYAKKTKKFHYIYRLGKYYGSGLFRQLKDGSIETSLCKPIALQPLPTGVIVDAHRLKSKKGDIYQLIDSKYKTLYLGKVVLLKENLDWRKKEAFRKVEPKQQSHLGWHPVILQATRGMAKNKLVVDVKKLKSISPLMDIKKIMKDGQIAVVVPSNAPTGLVIDASRLGLQLAAVSSIRVKSGKKISTRHSLIDYAKNIDAASHSGANPVIVKAVNMGDDHGIILSDYDADRLMKLKSIKRILHKITIVL